MRYISAMSRQYSLFCGGIALVVSLVGLAGCTRTSDGSIEYRSPISMPTFPRLSPISLFSRRQAPDATASQFPPPPAAKADAPLVAQSSVPAGEAPGRRAAPRTNAPKVWVPRMAAAQLPGAATEPQAVENASGTLSCRNASGTGGRIRIVCE